jgi:hypothetical protein
VPERFGRSRIPDISDVTKVLMKRRTDVSWISRKFSGAPVSSPQNVLPDDRNVNGETSLSSMISSP